MQKQRGNEISLSTFLRLLERVKDSYTWEDEDGAIRGRRGTTVVCPITAVANSVTDRHFSLVYTMDAALSLSPNSREGIKDLHDLVAASDPEHEVLDTNSSGIRWEVKKRTKAQKIIRELLLKTLGLQLVRKEMQ